jgi:hypothetical protein
MAITFIRDDDNEGCDAGIGYLPSDRVLVSKLSKSIRQVRGSSTMHGICSCMVGPPLALEVGGRVGPPLEVGQHKSHTNM